MAAVRQSFEAEDSRTNREIDQGSAAVRFTTVNGSRAVASPSQNTSFRPDPIALSEPHNQQPPTTKAAPLERQHRPLFVDSEEGKGVFHDEVSTHSPPENQSNRAGKRKRSAEAFNVSPEFALPPARRDEVFRSSLEMRSPAQSLPPLAQFREGEPQHVTDQMPGWRQQRPSSSHPDVQLTDAMRKDSHTHQTRNDHVERSDSPQLETDLQSDQESEMQTESASGRKGPAQRRRFSQRTKTGCHTCRRRKKKCDEAKPYCQNCTRGGFPCEGYGPKNELNVKLLSKAVPLQAKTAEGHAPPAQRQTAPGAPTEHWLETQRRFSHESRVQSFGDGVRYAQANGMRPAAPSSYESTFPPDRFNRASLPEAARPPPSSSRFSGLSAPSIMTDTNGSSLSRSGGGTSLGSAFDTPRLMLSNRLGLNPASAPYPPSGATEKDNMLNGRDYRHFTDPLLGDERAWCREALEQFNNASKPFCGLDMDDRIKLFRKIVQPDRLLRLDDPRNHPVGELGSRIVVEAPFKCEYGYNVNIADDVVIQSGCEMYDPCTITIGRGTIVGPNVKFYGLGSSLDPRIRNGSQGRLRGGKILVEEDCFIGGNVLILPNVTIGRESVVFAGTVVNKSVPPGVVVAGNPMEIVREIGPSPDQEYNTQPPVMMGNLWPDRLHNRGGRM